MSDTVSAVVGGKEITFETGAIAAQADCAVVARQADTVLLVAVVSEKEPAGARDFFPLTVDYRERRSAAGLIPGGFFKRKMRSSDRETLVSRLIDRSLRPLFPKGYRCETQVVATVLSFDPSADPASLAITAAAAALHISDIPWNGPIAGLRVGTSPAGRLTVNPDLEEKDSGGMDLVVAAGPRGLVMVEGSLCESQERQVLDALAFAQKAAEPLLACLERWRQMRGVAKRAFTPPPGSDDPFVRTVRERSYRHLVEILTKGGSKKERGHAVRTLVETLCRDLGIEGDPEKPALLRSVVEDYMGELARKRLKEEGKRIDGRGLTDIRAIWGTVGWLPRAHGSALFTRGETQAMVTCTLGTGEDEQVVETLLGEERERFLVHYNFPPYSVGEIRPLRAPGRREIGHGELARRALESVLPEHEEFPYTIRIVSDISESNGSSSMATVCGGSLALMDAGVPIRAPVAGIAMGLIKEQGTPMVLSDILGEEDHLGDMDFKVAGTRTGITALQLDNKVGELPAEVLAAALEQARQARMHILEEMARILEKPRDSLSPYAPRAYATRIRKERIRDLIGPGGRIIQEIQKETNTKIQVDDEGTVRIYSLNQADLEEAIKLVNHYTAELEVGKIYRGTVVAVKDFGAFVRIYSSEGLVHISELEPRRVERVSDIVKEGDEIIVKVLDVDSQGKIRLSRKAALNAPASEIQN